MSAIDDKYDSLKASGRDLGAAQGREEDAEAGGRVRRYENGHIYWSSATGAHMVRGGILDLYLARGGPGVNPATGGRDLGYPTLDEEFVPGTNAPHNLFEWGAIYWTPGTGGVVLVGNWAHAGKTLGLPLSNPVDVAGGRAACSPLVACLASTVSWWGISMSRSLGGRLLSIRTAKDTSDTCSGTR